MILKDLLFLSFLWLRKNYFLCLPRYPHFSKLNHVKKTQVQWMNWCQGLGLWQQSKML